MTDQDSNPIEEETDEQTEEEQEENDAIRDAFDSALLSEAEEEDDIKMQMIGAGATFKNVTRLYNQFCIDAGLAISAADRKQLVEETLTGKEFETEEDFNECVDSLVASVKGATERSAGALIRSYAKKNELVAYARPKSEGTGRSGFISKYHAWLVENPLCTKDEAVAFIKGEGDHDETSDNVKRHISNHVNTWSLVDRIMAPLKTKAA